MYEEIADSDLLLMSREEPDAFGVLYERHAEGLLGYFARRTFDVEARQFDPKRQLPGLAVAGSVWTASTDGAVMLPSPTPAMTMPLAPFFAAARIKSGDMFAWA